MRRPRKSRTTLLKIRAVPLKRMPKSRFLKLIRQACRLGVIPDDIELTTLNWDHAHGQRYTSGSVLSARNREELRNCYDMLLAAGKQVRVEAPE